eukprot:COSAG01_NODE_8119_length_2867_cov_8.576199_1_plen_107_part_00
MGLAPPRTPPPPPPPPPREILRRNGRGQRQLSIRTRRRRLADKQKHLYERLRAEHGIPAPAASAAPATAAAAGLSGGSPPRGGLGALADQLRRTFSKLPIRVPNTV